MAHEQPLQPAALKADRQWGSTPRLPITPNDEPSVPLPNVTATRNVMWRYAGLFRTRERLSRAVRSLEAGYADVLRAREHTGATPEFWRRLNLLTVARLVARAAYRREESRGGHFREDFPKRNDLHWQVHIVETEKSGT